MLIFLNTSKIKQVSFEIEIDPVAQPRPKAARIGTSIRIYTPQGVRVKSYKSAIKKAFLDAAGENFEEGPNGPIHLVVKFLFKRPADKLRVSESDVIIPHLKKPDVDNLVKSVMDALNGVAWHDDSQVYSLLTSKEYLPVKLGGKSGRKRTTARSRVLVQIQYKEII